MFPIQRKSPPFKKKSKIRDGSHLFIFARISQEVSSTGGRDLDRVGTAAAEVGCKLDRLADVVQDAVLGDLHLPARLEPLPRFSHFVDAVDQLDVALARIAVS